jgi:hypothetical protein
VTEENVQDCINEELSLLYSSCVSEIISFKLQQWHTTNYGLLLYAAITSISQIIKPLGCIEWFLLYVVSASVLGTGLYMIKELFKSIRVRRKRLTEIRKHASDNFMVAWGCGKPRKEIIDNPDEKLKLSWFFYSVFIVGFVATIWFLTRQIMAC